MRWKHVAGAVLGGMALALSLQAQSDRWVVIRAGRLFDSQQAVSLAMRSWSCTVNASPPWGRPTT
jgi:hypothetical protein